MTKEKLAYCMKKLIFIGIFISFISGCTNASDARRALQSSGYTDIVIGGYDWFACGERDFYSTKFTATNTAGNRVKGTVCSGLMFKNATIRF